MDNLWIIAQAGPNQAPSRIPAEPLTSQGQQGSATVQQDPNAAGGRQGSSPSLMQYLPFVVIMIVLFMLMIRGPRKQQREQKQMLQSLKKNDRVRTIGGIYGTVIEVKGDEVVLKVDEANNTRIHVSVSAIGKNLSSEEKS
jgi:preprotein translocase subunit YajC